MGSYRGAVTALVVRLGDDDVVLARDGPVGHGDVAVLGVLVPVEGLHEPLGVRGQGVGVRLRRRRDPTCGVVHVAPIGGADVALGSRSRSPPPRRRGRS